MSGLAAKENKVFANPIYFFFFDFKMYIKPFPKLKILSVNR